MDGLGPEMRPWGLKFCPPTPADGRSREAPVWMRPRAPCLARTAPGRRRTPSGRYYGRPARSSQNRNRRSAGSGSTDRTSRWRLGLRRKCRQWSAEGRASFRQRTPRLRRPGSWQRRSRQRLSCKQARPWRDWKPQRRSALHSPRFFAGESQGAARAPLNPPGRQSMSESPFAWNDPFSVRPRASGDPGLTNAESCGSRFPLSRERTEERSVHSTPNESRPHARLGVAAAAAPSRNAAPDRGRNRLHATGSP